VPRDLAGHRPPPPPVPPYRPGVAEPISAEQAAAMPPAGNGRSAVPPYGVTAAGRRAVAPPTAERWGAVPAHRPPSGHQAVAPGPGTAGAPPLPGGQAQAAPSYRPVASDQTPGGQPAVLGPPHRPMPPRPPTGEHTAIPPTASPAAHGARPVTGEHAPVPPAPGPDGGGGPSGEGAGAQHVQPAADGAQSEQGLHVQAQARAGER
jgi:hypothetical protein